MKRSDGEWRWYISKRKQQITMKTCPTQHNYIIVINISLSTLASTTLQSNGPIGQPQSSCYSTIHHGPGLWPVPWSSYGIVAPSVRLQAWVGEVGSQPGDPQTMVSGRCPQKGALGNSSEVQWWQGPLVVLFFKLKMVKMGGYVLVSMYYV